MSLLQRLLEHKSTLIQVLPHIDKISVVKKLFKRDKRYYEDYELQQ
jgi:hypothetical protein